LLVGIALDRLSVKAVSLTLFAGTMIGSVLAAHADGPATFAIAQAVLGLGTSGMLLCPFTLAAQLLPAAKFPLWSGVTLGVGNTGMLLSASPLAWLLAKFGWRAAFLIACAFGMLIAVLVLVRVPGGRPTRGSTASLPREVAAVRRLAGARSLRDVMIAAFTSLAVVLVTRGVWAGPWLMDVKGATRMQAGHALLLFTLALSVGPALSGLLESSVGDRRLIVAGGQSRAAIALILIACGAPGGPLSATVGVRQLAWTSDAALFATVGLCISVQPLLYAMALDRVAAAALGKTMSAVALSFFLGTAALQALSGLVASFSGMPAVFLVMGVLLLATTAAFCILAPRAAPSAGTAAKRVTGPQG
jgi:predicted MFS family arabinose efflux permease